MQQSLSHFFFSNIETYNPESIHNQTYPYHRILEIYVWSKITLNLIMKLHTYYEALCLRSLLMNIFVYKVPQYFHTPPPNGRVLPYWDTPWFLILIGVNIGVIVSMTQEIKKVDRFIATAGSDWPSGKYFKILSWQTYSWCVLVIESLCWNM